MTHHCNSGVLFCKSGVYYYYDYYDYYYYYYYYYYYFRYCSVQRREEHIGGHAHFNRSCIKLIPCLSQKDDRKHY